MTTKNSPKRGARQETADENLVKALSHPLRWQILAAISEGVGTPAGIARRLGVRTENVSYHVRVLCELGVIELVRTTPVRGALEHHYRATHGALISDADAAAMPPGGRRSTMHEILRRTIQDLVRIGASDQPFERSDAHFSRVPLQLDEEGYAAVVELLSGTLDRVLEIQAESLARMGGDDSAAVRTEVGLLHFPYVPPDR